MTKNKNLIVYFPCYTGLPKSFFNPLLRKFRRDGFTTYSVKYNLFGRGDISTLAVQALDQIKKLDISKFDTVTFIGHSMGGLVARKVASLGTIVPDYLITLGSPHGGVQAATWPFSWLGGHSVLQMRPGSKWLQYCTSIDIPILTITGEWDVLVLAGGLGDEDGPNKNVTNISVPRTGHLGLITNYRTYGEMYAWLVYDQFNRLKV